MFFTSDLEGVQGKYDVVTCLDVMIHYPQDKADAMVQHLATLADKRLIVSFAPYTFSLALLKRIGARAGAAGTRRGRAPCVPIELPCPPAQRRRQAATANPSAQTTPRRALLAQNVSSQMGSPSQSHPAPPRPPQGSSSRAPPRRPAPTSTRRTTSRRPSARRARAAAPLQRKCCPRCIRIPWVGGEHPAKCA